MEDCLHHRALRALLPGITFGAAMLMPTPLSAAPAASVTLYDNLAYASGVSTLIQNNWQAQGFRTSDLGSTLTEVSLGLRYLGVLRDPIAVDVFDGIYGVPGSQVARIGFLPNSLPPAYPQLYSVGDLSVRLNPNELYFIVIRQTTNPFPPPFSVGWVQTDPTTPPAGVGTADVPYLVGPSPIWMPITPPARAVMSVKARAAASSGSPGDTAQNPLLPSQVGDSFQFTFSVEPGRQVFIDPEVAVGYDYTSTGGPLFSSVTPPAGINADNRFDLYFSGDSCASYTQYVSSILGDDQFFFDTPQNCFSIRNIDVSAQLDPADPLAFVTGLSFDRAGEVTVNQKPIRFTVGGGEAQDVPGPLPLLGAGAALGWSRRLRRRIRQSRRD